MGFNKQRNNCKYQSRVKPPVKGKKNKGVGRGNSGRATTTVEQQQWNNNSGTTTVEQQHKTTVSDHKIKRSSTKNRRQKNYGGQKMQRCNQTPTRIDTGFVFVTNVQGKVHLSAGQVGQDMKGIFQNMRTSHIDGYFTARGRVAAPRCLFQCG